MNFMDKLKKYSPKELGTSLNAATATEPKGIIKYRYNNQVTIKKGYFLTTNLHLDPKLAQEYNAIPYAPKFLTELETADANQVELESPMGGNEPTWVWPVWGHHGGGSEIVLTKGALGKKSSTKISVCLCPDDGFRTAGAEAFEKHFVIPYTQSTMSWLEDAKGSIARLDTGPNFIVKNENMAVMWRTREGRGYYYSISCGVVELTNKTRLKFWGYIWKDNKETMTRTYLDPPVYQEYLFGVPYKDLWTCGDFSLSRIMYDIFHALEERDATEPVGLKPLDG